jgi:hypothetical protein
VQQEHINQIQDKLPVMMQMQDTMLILQVNLVKRHVLQEHINQIQDRVPVMMQMLDIM